MSGTQQTPSLEIFPEYLRAALRSELAEGESVLWSDRPCARYAWGNAQSAGWSTRAGRLLEILVMSTLSAIPMTIGYVIIDHIIERLAHVPSLWAGLLLVLLFGSLGLAFLGCGLLGCLRPLYVMWRASRMTYILTDQRALVFERRLRSIDVKSISFREMEPVRLRRQRKSGIVDVVFATEAIDLTSGDDSRPVYAFLDAGFLAIQGAASLSARVEKLRKAA